ncbi:tyrosine-type recombinase/integrase [Alkalihalobacillus sp. AL-G]|nr:tyrosine-type recombinase/integrase [Alkalihalobacillus sp. AL-G]
MSRSLATTKSLGYALTNIKTANSRKQISISQYVVKALVKHKEDQDTLKDTLKDGYEDNSLVFPNLYGGFKNPDNLRREFNSLIEKSGVLRINFHALRHTHATWLLKNGINPKVVSERLGYHDVGITLKTYSHVSYDLQEEAA